MNKCLRSVLLDSEALETGNDLDAVSKGLGSDVPGVELTVPDEVGLVVDTLVTGIGVHGHGSTDHGPVALAGHHGGVVEVGGVVLGVLPKSDDSGVLAPSENGELVGLVLSLKIDDTVAAILHAESGADSGPSTVASLDGSVRVLVVSVKSNLDGFVVLPALSGLSVSGLVEGTNELSVGHEVLGVDLGPILLLLGQLHGLHFGLELGNLSGGLFLAGSAALVQLVGEVVELGGGVGLEGFEHLLEVIVLGGELTLDGGQLRLDRGDGVLVGGRGNFGSGDFLLELFQLSVTPLLGESLLELVLGGIGLEGHLLVNHNFSCESNSN